ncbi:MAG TPA: N-acetylmuramoyl-L-alanine amidase [Candidatus Hydrogenedentes bacterium]|nr:N-acetylmuramoyl-L-alanine amidase [Candidatus Hydrogenedentota bacterium]HOS03933.1 N-acetylmuramoyl-L-alanine amidase [Candidatus Hydrogenedentota bacterium]
MMLTSAVSLSRRAPCSILMGACALAVVIGWTEQAVCATQPVHIEVALADGTRSASVATVDRDGAPWISLSTVAKQLGGDCRVDSGRIYVDFAGSTAWTNLGSVEVDGPAGRFALAAPPVHENGEILIARHDVFVFFSRAFRVSIRQVAAPAQASTGDVLEPLSDEELLREEAIPSASSLEAAPAMPVIVIDAGHGGTDMGAEGTQGAREKDIALIVAKTLEASLRATQRVVPALLRSKDVELAPQARARLAREAKGTLLISLHVGASYDPAAAGFELFVASPSSAEGVSSGATGDRRARTEASLSLARALDAALQRATGTASRGVRSVPLQLFQTVDMPGVLVEMGCVSSPAEETAMQTREFQAAVAAGVVEGILTHLGMTPASPSPETAP